MITDKSAIGPIYIDPYTKWRWEIVNSYKNAGVYYFNQQPWDGIVHEQIGTVRTWYCKEHKRTDVSFNSLQAQDECVYRCPKKPEVFMYRCFWLPEANKEKALEMVKAYFKRQIEELERRLATMQIDISIKEEGIQNDI